MRAPGESNRLYFRPTADGSTGPGAPACFEEVNEEEGWVVSSQLVDRERHCLAIDLDVPAFLVPSSTPGHSHLYIDKDMKWSVYAKLLHALGECGILEDGYVGACLVRGQTLLRPPGVSKAEHPLPSLPAYDAELARASVQAELAEEEPW